jgi:hypothetical protein
MLPDASETVEGVAEIATTAEAQALTDDARIVTPAKLLDVFQGNGGFLEDIQAMSDPGADRILFWDDGGSTVNQLAASTGITISGTNLTTNDSAIDHDALNNFVANEHINHSSVDITAGNGLTGGGDLTTTRTLNVVGTDGITANADDVALDVSSLSTINGSSAASGDSYLMYDLDAAVHKRITHEIAGIPVESAISTTQIFVDADMNRVHQLSGSTDRQWSLNTGVGVVGNIIVLIQTGTGSIEIAGTATVNSANGLFTRTQYSVAVLLCVASNSW